MISQGAYLDILRKQLGCYPDAEETVREIAVHIDQRMAELMLTGRSEAEALSTALSELGDPSELGKSLYRAALNSIEKEPSIFVLVNWILSAAGFGLLLMVRINPEFSLRIFWKLLAEMNFAILFLYWGYWLYFGYRLGRDFGPAGRIVMRRSIFLALAPNFILMFAVLLIPLSVKWFEPMLTPSFVIICTLSTILFYPAGTLAYKIGMINGI